MTHRKLTCCCHGDILFHPATRAN